MEARGNGPSYPAQGDNFVRSSLAWGPLPGLIARAYGWQSQKRTTYAAGFHTYTLEWTEDFMKVYVDSRLKAMLDLSINNKAVGKGGYFFNRGKFPVTATNGTATEIVVQNPWKDAGQAAPFDQSACFSLCFVLIYFVLSFFFHCDFGIWVSVTLMCMCVYCRLLLDPEPCGWRDERVVPR